VRPFDFHSDHGGRFRRALATPPRARQFNPSIADESNDTRGRQLNNKDAVDNRSCHCHNVHGEAFNFDGQVAKKDTQRQPKVW